MAIRRNLKGMNILIFMTDQQRAIQHFPKGWAAKHLHGDDRLRRYGLTFPRAFCNACMCSPSRATFMTGYFPAQHGVKWTLEENMPASEYPQQELPLGLPNLATIMSSVGYATPYKGKFHLTKPANKEGKWMPQDVEKYGFQRWDPADAGANQDPSEFGGGDANNDGRFVNSKGPGDTRFEGVLDYLNSAAPHQQPFVLVVSLVNPHDVLAYPNTALDNGYNRAWLKGDIGLPATVGEDLSTKPDVQRQFLALSQAGIGQLSNRQEKLNYLNFYGNLMKSSDNYLVQILDTLEERRLLENTLIIRTSDHGEMGLTHGGQRQKNFNFYEESLRVPLIYSNPQLYPKAQTSDAMVSHVDFLPTLASLFDVPEKARAKWEGVDYSKIVLNPKSKPVQKYIAFTYDDYQSGQASGPYPGPMNHIVSIREDRYKLAKYYDVNYPHGTCQWEMYDLLTDPLETRNLAWEGRKQTPKNQQEFRRLQRQLDAVIQKRLQPLTKVERASAGGAALG